MIVGPTAVGKTPLGLALAKKHTGEILSADSQQVWRGFDVGTAKASPAERTAVPHHLIDLADATETFDAARFVTLADAAIADIHARGKKAFVVGGTGMYLRMLEFGLCEAPPRDGAIRATLEAEARQKGLTTLHAELARLDPDSARRIHPNDPTRIIRAMEILRISSVPASRWRSSHGFATPRYRTLKLGLDIPRPLLYERINARVDAMIGGGLVEEVRALLARYSSSCQPFSAVGYREIVAHLEGKMDLATAISLTKKNTRHFAKRQLTWFRADPAVQWFHPEDASAIGEAVGRFLK